MPTVTFFAPGIPAPGGSKKAFMRPGMKFPVVVEDCKRTKDWRAVVALAARDAYRGDPMEGPLAARVIFYMPRPKGHYGAKGLKPSAPKYPTTKPDATKLWRSTEDALTAILWRDDAQIVRQMVSKEYAVESSGASIVVEAAS